jgi:hypothetical protein
MEESKYGKYIKRGTAGKEPGPETTGVTSAVLESLDDWKGIQHRINWGYISQPALLVEEPHSHDFDEFLFFLGSNPADPKDFGAEIEISLGKEGEKQIVDTATVVCIPKGMVHCPLNFKKIDKPVLFGYIYMSPEYARKPVS